jgi:hypothetical protein
MRSRWQCESISIKGYIFWRFCLALNVKTQAIVTAYMVWVERSKFAPAK